MHLLSRNTANTTRQLPFSDNPTLLGQTCYKCSFFMDPLSLTHWTKEKTDASEERTIFDMLRHSVDVLRHYVNALTI